MTHPAPGYEAPAQDSVRPARPLVITNKVLLPVSIVVSLGILIWKTSAFFTGLDLRMQRIEDALARPTVLPSDIRNWARAIGPINGTKLPEFYTASEEAKR